MQISLISYVKSCPHFESARWSCAADNAEEKIGSTQYNLTGKIALIQDEHLRFMCEISKTHNEVNCKQLFEIKVMTQNTHKTFCFLFLQFHPFQDEH